MSAGQRVINVPQTECCASFFVGELAGVIISIRSLRLDVAHRNGNCGSMSEKGIDAVRANERTVELIEVHAERTADTAFLDDLIISEHLRLSEIRNVEELIHGNCIQKAGARLSGSIRPVERELGKSQFRN